MPATRIVLVVGATGAQGGSVASHLLSQGKFRVRCLTRNPDSERATALRTAGAETVQGDLDDPLALRAAVEGCYAVFGVTSFWEHFQREYQHGRNLVESVSSGNVSHFVFSTLPHVSEITRRELAVPHFDIKARLEEYCRELGLPATYLHVAFYYENFLSFFPPQRAEDNTYAFGFPQGDTPLAAVSVEDVGGVVASILSRPADFQNKVVGVVGDDRPPQQYADIMTRVLGTKVVYNHIDRDAFSALPFPGAGELANMFDFNRRFISNRRADLQLSRTLFPKMQNFETWAAANRDRFRTVIASDAGAGGA